MTAIVIGAIVLAVIVIVIAVIAARHRREQRLAGRRVEAESRRELALDRQLDADRQQAEADLRAARAKRRRPSPSSKHPKRIGHALKPPTSRNRHASSTPTWMTRRPAPASTAQIGTPQERHSRIINGWRRSSDREKIFHLASTHRCSRASAGERRQVDGRVHVTERLPGFRRDCTWLSRAGSFAVPVRGGLILWR